MQTVFLNAKKIDFDGKLDFSPIMECGIIQTYESSTNDEIIERVQNQNIVVTKEMPIGRELIEKFPPCVKMICEAGTGYNNIDIAAAKSKGIAVCNIPSYSTEAVAQLAIALILSLSSSIARQQVMLKQNNYRNFYRCLGVPHSEINQKILGVIGTGRIGQRVIHSALALGMNVLCYSRTKKEWDNPRVNFTSLEALLSHSDFVSIHCPLTPETKRLINKETLALMKSTAYVINTSRGAIINEADLIDALKRGIIAGAALDVFEKEPPDIDNPLFTMNHVILTPHIGWKCIETRQRLLQLIAGNIQAFQKGKPINVVNG
ncbi:MAG: D-2-hydroxyacid dehydrogenase [Oscillospiraceae bacterium]|jgi:glycerate dehydrogenase|nr:D-2-hydroxyacid dehydrogenase [Oscillospiraceae bacterium]